MFKKHSAIFFSYICYYITVIFHLVYNWLPILNLIWNKRNYLIILIGKMLRYLSITINIKYSFTPSSQKALALFRFGCVHHTSCRRPADRLTIRLLSKASWFCAAEQAHWMDEMRKAFHWPPRGHRCRLLRIRAESPNSAIVSPAICIAHDNDTNGGNVRLCASGSCCDFSTDHLCKLFVSNHWLCITSAWVCLCVRVKQTAENRKHLNSQPRFWCNTYVLID